MDSTLNTGEQLMSIPKVPNVASLWISIDNNIIHNILCSPGKDKSQYQKLNKEQDFQRDIKWETSSKMNAELWLILQVNY